MITLGCCLIRYGESRASKQFLLPNDKRHWRPVLGTKRKEFRSYAVCRNGGCLLAAGAIAEPSNSGIV
jgi:hypothetical protein